MDVCFSVSFEVHEKLFVKFKWRYNRSQVTVHKMFGSLKQF